MNRRERKKEEGEIVQNLIEKEREGERERKKEEKSSESRSNKGVKKAALCFYFTPTHTQYV